jgi:hypothetical protein
MAWAWPYVTHPENKYHKLPANVLYLDEVLYDDRGVENKVSELYEDTEDYCGICLSDVPLQGGADGKGFDNIVRHTNDYRCQDIRFEYC